MERLCDEILQLIFYELDDPNPLILVSKRFHTFSKDPYVRAQYFLTRYGPIEAMFGALGRGKLVDTRVLDILLTSGAHLSRYIVQVAIHHYFRTPSHVHFIKTTWVRSLDFPTFVYFLKLAADTYGSDIPLGKGEDDGTLFQTFLKGSRLPPESRRVGWEEIKVILEKYKFLPFSNKDPIMAQFPLALAVEPRLLPLAVANGFVMDNKYRDFVFRKMFERPVPAPAGSETTHADDIITNVRELCRLDSTMFLSRTVAAEICMEATTNDTAYAALKKLDKNGELRFELSSLVEDLIKLFSKTRSITTSAVTANLRRLWLDFPALHTNPTIRQVMITVVFLAASATPPYQHTQFLTLNQTVAVTPADINALLEQLSLKPTRKDIFNVLTNPFVDKYSPILDWVKSPRGLDMGAHMKEFITEVAERCLEVGCKGKMLKRMFEQFLHLHRAIANATLTKHQIEVEDVPSWEEGEGTEEEREKACKAFQAKLSRDYIRKGFDRVPAPGEEDHNDAEPGVEAHDEEGADGLEDEVVVPEDDFRNVEDLSELGIITQDTLTSRIREDESMPSGYRSRRRRIHWYAGYAEAQGKLEYPSDSMEVGRFIKSQYGTRSLITAIFMTHAVINDNTSTFHHYLPYNDNPLHLHVPITLKHFKLLARLGKSPPFYLYNDISLGAAFYFTEADYAVPKHYGTSPKVKVKTELDAGYLPTSGSESSLRGKKRPRRQAATTVNSYVVPDSDDEAIAADDEWDYLTPMKGKRKEETSLQKWIHHLAILLKDEQRKYKEKKKRVEKDVAPGTKVRVVKSDFHKSLSHQIRIFRKEDTDKRTKMYGPDIADDEFEDNDDEDYNSRVKKRKTTRV